MNTLKRTEPLAYDFIIKNYSNLNAVEGENLFELWSEVRTQLSHGSHATNLINFLFNLDLNKAKSRFNNGTSRHGCCQSIDSKLTSKYIKRITSETLDEGQASDQALIHNLKSIENQLTTKNHDDIFKSELISLDKISLRETIHSSLQFSQYITTKNLWFIYFSMLKHCISNPEFSKSNLWYDSIHLMELMLINTRKDCQYAFVNENKHIKDIFHSLPLDDTELIKEMLNTLNKFKDDHYITTEKISTFLLIEKYQSISNIIEIGKTYEDIKIVTDYIENNPIILFDNLFPLLMASNHDHLEDEFIFFDKVAGIHHTSHYFELNPDSSLLLPFKKLITQLKLSVFPEPLQKIIDDVKSELNIS